MQSSNLWLNGRLKKPTGPFVICSLQIKDVLFEFLRLTRGGKSFLNVGSSSNLVASFYYKANARILSIITEEGKIITLTSKEKLTFLDVAISNTIHSFFLVHKKEKMLFLVSNDSKNRPIVCIAYNKNVIFWSPEARKIKLEEFETKFNIYLGSIYRMFKEKKESH